MAIAFDSSSVNSAGSGTSLSVSHTTSGTNRYLTVYVFNFSGSDNVTGVTYNGVSMSLIRKNPNADVYYNYCFQLVNPTSGANNITVSRSGSTGSLGVIGMSYNGCLQSGQPDAQTDSGLSGSAPITGTLSSIADNCWFAMGIIRNLGSGGNANINSNGTTRQNGSVTEGMFAAGDSTAPLTPAGSYSIPAGSGAGNFRQIMISFAPSAAPVNGNFIAFM